MKIAAYKNFLIVALTAALSIPGRTQDTCITISGGVTLTSQAQLDAYWQQNPGICIDSILGDLILAGDVEDLSGFMGLRYVGGGIFAPGSLQRRPKLRGLDSLREIDDFLILNTQVYDLDALSNLRAIGRNIDNKISGGFTKKLTFGAGSYDNLDALSNLELAQDCKLSISNCTVRDATGLKNVRGFYSVSLYQSNIEIFPNIPAIDSLHSLYVYRVNGLTELSFSGLHYLNQLEIIQSPNLISLTFEKPIYMGRRKINPDDIFYDNNADISISGSIECLTAEFRRADSLQFLEIGISSLPLRSDCPAPDLSLFPIDKLNYSGIPVGDTLILPFYPPNDNFTWGNLSRNPNFSNYGVQYRITGLYGLKHLVIPDTGTMNILFHSELQDIVIDTISGRGQLQSLVVDDNNILQHVQAFEQLHGSVNGYGRSVLYGGNGTPIDAPAILIKDCENIQFRKSDFENVDSTVGIWLDNLPSTTTIPEFSNLKWARQVGLRDVPIGNDTLFSTDTRIENYFGVRTLVNNLPNSSLYVHANPVLDTFAFFNEDLNYSGIELDYNNTDLLIEGLNDVKTSGSLWIRGVNEDLNPQPNLLSNLEEVNSLLYSDIQNNALPSIGKINSLYEYRWFDTINQRWFTDRYNETLKVDNVQNITDATAVCPLINSGNYETLDLDPMNSYPLHDAAALVGYCDSARVSRTSDLGQWKAFAAYPTLNSPGGTLNFKGLEEYTGTLNYRIVSATGQELGRGRLVKGSFGRVDAISLPASLPEGQYFLDVLDDKGKRGTSVIQVVHRP